MSHKKQHPLEREVLRHILAALGHEPDLLLLRNSVGASGPTGRMVSHGLGTGSPDLVALLRVHMLGRIFAVWIALEVKRPGLGPNAKQRRCHAVWRSFGAFVAVVHSVEEARRAVNSVKGFIAGRGMLAASLSDDTARAAS